MEWTLEVITVPITTIRYERGIVARSELFRQGDDIILRNYHSGLTTIRICDDFAYMGGGLLENLIRLGLTEIKVYICHDPTLKEYLLAQGFVDA